MNTGRNNPCFNVQWPSLYRGQDFVGEGTMVDLSLEGGRFAGTMPVAVGMQLGLFIDSPWKSEDPDHNGFFNNQVLALQR